MSTQDDDDVYTETKTKAKNPLESEGLEKQKLILSDLNSINWNTREFATSFFSEPRFTQLLAKMRTQIHNPQHQIDCMIILSNLVCFGLTDAATVYRQILDPICYTLFVNRSNRLVQLSGCYCIRSLMENAGSLLVKSTILKSLQKHSDLGDIILSKFEEWVVPVIGNIQKAWQELFVVIDRNCRLLTEDIENVMAHDYFCDTESQETQEIKDAMMPRFGVDTLVKKAFKKYSRDLD